MRESIDRRKVVRKMAMYSMQLREFIESAVESMEEYYTLSQKEKIEKGRKVLFDFDYPIFDEDYRKTFETHFIRNFYMREIGFETDGLFKFQLETWLNINMPYFNKLFESEKLSLEYDTLKNVDESTTRNTKNDKNQRDASNANSTTQSDSNTDTDGNVKDDNFSRNIEANTPDSRLKLTTNKGEGVIEYASNIQENTDLDKQESENHSNTNASSEGEQTQNYESDINETEDYIEHRAGKIGNESYPELIEKHRQSFLRIENRIFREMNQLFMLVY